MNWKKLKHHEVQSALWRCDRRFPIVCAGRGSGKTELARRRVVRYLPVIKPWSDPMYFYALPTYAQAKRVAWEAIKQLVPREWIKGEPSESNMCIKTVFGSSLYVVGLDKPQRIEGNQWDGGVVDESSDQRPGVFDKSIRPALSHRKGWCWRIGVPKRFGIGAAEFRVNFHKHLDPNEDPDMVSFTWSSEDILPPEEIESAKNNLSPEDYDEQYRSRWLSTKGAVYSQFKEDLNVTAAMDYKPEQTIIVGSDFNVDPMSWVLTQTIPNGLFVFDEVRLHNTNTMLTLQNLYERYGKHASGWVFMGDASSRARKTSASYSDYVQIKQDDRFINKRMAYTKSNPPVDDRNAAVNALLCNAANIRRLFIHPRCKALIADLNMLSYKPGTREIQLQPGLGHMSDGLGYIIYRLYPITTHTEIESPIVGT